MRFEVAVPARGRGWLRRASRCFVARALYGPWRLTFVVRKERRGHLVAQLKSAPSMGAIPEVKVLSKSGHRNRSEPQLRKGDRPWGGSGERSRGPMNKNQI
jgi:hypothetical protein